MFIRYIKRLPSTFRLRDTRFVGRFTRFFPHILYRFFKLIFLAQPWPIVERFLKELPPGSVGLDVGCGNGKYLSVNSNIFIVASDR